MPSPLIARLQSHAGEPVAEELRDEIGGRLNDAFVRGDVDEDAYQRLLGLLYQARTAGELLPVAEALPRTATYAEPEIVRQSRAAGTLEPARPAPLEPARGRSAAWLVVSLGAVALVLVVLAALLAL